MMKKFEDIKTATELIQYIGISGMPLDQDSICRMQDIIGNSSIKELVTLANDIGRNDENGNPDPKGSWSSGRKATRNTFYALLFHIWNWEDATRFWNEHTNPEREILTQIREENKKLTKQNKELESRRDELLKEVKCGADRIVEVMDEAQMAKEKLEKLEVENLKLKAKLYDMMMAEA